MKIRVFQKNGKVYMELPAELPLSDELLKKGSVIIKPVVPGAYLLLEKHSLADYLAQQNHGELKNDHSANAKVVHSDSPLETPSGSKPETRSTLPNPAQPVPSSSRDPRLETRSLSGQASNNAYKDLRRNGYAILFNQNDAMLMSKDASDDIKSGRVLGTRGFDGKYYVCTRFFFRANAVRAKQALKNGPLTLDRICQQTKLDQVAVQAVLNLLLDNGELIETRKGEYSIA